MTFAKQSLPILLRALAVVSALVASVLAVCWARFGFLVFALLASVVVCETVLLAAAASTLAEDPTPEERETIEDVADKYGLSPRESEVLGVYARNRDICASAHELFISPSTMKSHLSHIYAKVGVCGCEELLKMCDGIVGRAA